MTRRYLQAGVLAGLALVSLACDVQVGDKGITSVDFSAGKASDEWTRTYDLKPGGRLDIVNVNGQIHASGSTGTQVEIHATREVRSSSEEGSRDILQKAEMREQVTPDRVVIEAPDLRGTGARRPQMSIRYEVRVPAGLNLSFKTQNGDVRLENVKAARIEALTTNGGITGRGVTGGVEAQTVNGGIVMDLEAVSADSRMVTVNGGVVLTLSPTINADLEATVVNGGVMVQEGLTLSGDERSRQRVAGRLGSGGPRLVVTTTNGGVRVGPRGASGS
jgi:hypothetical protein